mmetsp:Transcript_29443/g.80885  ORF Transcript_29443/g.80885 Transcript_29443/m.80885 type:complete len:238 (+) Transcript_29443:2059-2772(+)
MIQIQSGRLVVFDLGQVPNEKSSGVSLVEQLSQRGELTGRRQITILAARHGRMTAREDAIGNVHDLQILQGRHIEGQTRRSELGLPGLFGGELLGLLIFALKFGLGFLRQLRRFFAQRLGTFHHAGPSQGCCCGCCYCCGGWKGREQGGRGGGCCCRILVLLIGCCCSSRSMAGLNGRLRESIPRFFQSVARLVQGLLQRSLGGFRPRRPHCLFCLDYRCGFDLDRQLEKMERPVWN